MNTVSKQANLFGKLDCERLMDAHPCISSDSFQILRMSVSSILKYDQNVTLSKYFSL